MAGQETGREREVGAAARRERKLAERALQESEERFRAIAEAAPIPIAISRLSDGLILHANAHLGPTFGLPSEEMVGRKAPDFYYDPADRQVLLDLLKRDGYVRDYEVRVKKADGAPFWVVISLRRITFDSEPALIAGFYDISERKRAEEALRDSEERFRLLAENAQDIIYRYRLTPARGFEYVSPAATTITGYTPEEHYADPDLGLKIVHPDDRGRLGRYFNAEGVFEHEIVLRWVRKDGTVIWTEQRNVPIHDEEGKLMAMEGVVRDITARKRAEETLEKAREELESTVERQMQCGNAYGLTFRELTVLHLMADGRSDKEIGSVLGISTLTAHKHVASILSRMGVASRTEASVRAVREGVLD